MHGAHQGEKSCYHVCKTLHSVPGDREPDGTGIGNPLLIKTRGGIMRYKKLAMIAAVAVLFSCNAADVTRLFKNVNLEKMGIRVNLSNVPPGLYDKPFIIKFDKLLRDISNGAVRVKAYNVYTVGNYDKILPQSIESFRT